MKAKTLLFLAVLVLAFMLVMRREAFTSPGTMVQLATSHVPTAEDEYFSEYLSTDCSSRSDSDDRKCLDAECIVILFGKLLS